MPLANFNGANWWIRHRLAVFRILTVVMAIMATLKLGDELRRLLWDYSFVGAVDLRNMHRWIGTWFSGASLFQTGHAAVYPPASYVMLWPLLGWISFSTARWEWAVVSIVGLATIGWLAIRITGAETVREKIFVALLILSINGTGVAIGSGQFILIILPALMAAGLAIDKSDANLARDFAAGALLTWAMIKPSLALPFIWIFLFRKSHWRAVLITTVLYGVLTFASLAAQKDTLSAIIEGVFYRATNATALFPGTRNIHALVVVLGRPEWMTISSVVMFVALGLCIYYCRHADQWVLVGVTALVARMWTYHRIYDDGLIMLAELALWRIARMRVSGKERVVSEILLVANAAVMLCLARFLDYSEYSWPPRWIWTCTSIQMLVWLTTLIFLIRYAFRDSSRARADSSRTEENYPFKETEQAGRLAMRQIVRLGGGEDAGA